MKVMKWENKAMKKKTKNKEKTLEFNPPKV